MRPARLLARGVIVIVIVIAFAGGVVGGTGALPSAHSQSPATSVACTPPPAGTLRLASIDQRPPVTMYVPPHAAGAPLVLALPGTAQTGGVFARYTGYSGLAYRAGFVVAYPTASGVRPSWNISGTALGKPDDVAYLRAVIAAALRASCADPARVGVTGVSNGGGMSARMACDAADVISAAAPVAGGYGSLPDCEPTRPVPILEVHGTSDAVVPYAGKGASGFGAVPRFLAQWRRLDGCPRAVAQRSRPSAEVTEFTWKPCRGGSIVVHDRIRDAVHDWPGGDDVFGGSEFSATARTWAFLSRNGR